MSVENALQLVRQICLDNKLKARLEAAGSSDQVVIIGRELGIGFRRWLFQRFRISVI